MRLVELREIELDDPVNDYLGNAQISFNHNQQGSVDEQILHQGGDRSAQRIR